MASSVNYNTVWTSIFEPVSTFGFLERYGRVSELTKRHDLPYHVVGSDLAGVVLRVGPGVNKWKPGDEVVAHCLSVELEDPAGHDDTMMDPQQRIWGFETNFGGLAELALVKSNQLMPKPGHLTWEEAAAPRAGQLHRLPAAGLPQRREHEAGRRRADLGRLRRPGLLRHPDGAQRRRHPGLRRLQPGEGRHRPRRWAPSWSSTAPPRATSSGRTSTTQDPKEWQRLGKKIRELTGGDDVDIVFEHPGRETFGASVYVAKKGGTIVTCASTSGYLHQYDNRYLWMNLKRIIGSHFANYKEAWEANRLIDKGLIHPTLSKVYPMDEVGQAAYDVHRNLHQGKVGVLTLAPEEGLGVRNPDKREKHLDAINRFRGV